MSRSTRKKGLLVRGGAPLAALAVGSAVAAALYAVRRRVPDIKAALGNRFLVLAGLFGSMAAVLFALFRAIRFLMRLYP